MRPDNDNTTTRAVPVRTVPVTSAYTRPDSPSARLWRQAQEVLPGGNSRTTVFMAPRPIYAAEGEGCWLVDVDGERRLDLLNNYTALIHGHAHPAVTDAATRRLGRGASFPLPTAEEIDLATLLVERVPSVERVRFTNSGSEAVMMAIKAARGFTGRPRIAKFEGAYHGSYDWAEVSLSSSPADWGSLEAPASVAYCKGTPPSVLEEVVVLPFNHARLAAMGLMDEAAYARLEEMGEKLRGGLAACLERAAVPGAVTGWARSSAFTPGNARSSITAARWPMKRSASASTSSTERS